MKILIKILILSISLNSAAQTYPIIEEFNPGTSWLFNNGAGIQNYGGAENYAATNIGVNPYPNNSIVTITSPVYSFTNCVSGLTVSFPISGKIENGFDVMYFQYFNGSWVTQSSFTGVQGSTSIYSITNNTTRFRFVLVTDCSVNGYKGGSFNPCSIIGYTTSCTPSPGNCSGTVNIYYYDITRFTVNCSSALPVELLVFEGRNNNCITNEFIWITATETNNNYFQLEQSKNGIDFKNIYQVNGKNELQTTIYNYKFDYSDLITYYRLKQVDFDGNHNYSNTISIESNCEVNKIKRRFNFIGQEVSEQYQGPVIIEYNNGEIKKLINQ